MQFVLALLSALPELLRLFSALAAKAEAARQRGEGYRQAVADGLRQSHEGLTAATAATLDAERRHREKPDTDDAFDREFERKD